MIANVIAGLTGNGIVAVGDYESLQTVTVGAGGQASINFTAIPSTYSHLQIRFIGRSTTADTNCDTLVRYNSDTGSNYSYHSLFGNGATASANAGSSTNSSYMTFRNLTAANAGAGQFGASVIDVLDYANTNKYKTTRGLGGYDSNGSGIITLGSLLWMNTAAITSINILPIVGSWAQYSSFALYGVK